MEAQDVIRLAAGAAGRRLILKLAALAGALFLPFIFFMSIIGMLGGSASARDNGCGTPGKPGGGADVDRSGNNIGAGDPTGNLRQKQTENAEIIDRVAKNNGLPGRATLIALMTALQESQLLNLNHGDRDSVGVFQQRPSTGWGTKEQIMNVEYAAKMFFFGGDKGDPPGLTDIKGWESMGYAQAAQAVQRSADGSLYAVHEDTARQIAQDAEIDLNRAGSATGNGQPSESAPGRPANAENCYPDSSKPGKPGEAFHDGAANWPANVKNPRSTEAAIEWAKRESETGGQDWYAMCLAFVARAYGWNFSGTNYAIQHYREMPTGMKHDKDRNPPPGALMFWDTGKVAGHVAVYLGNGMIASNDIKRSGYIDVVPATEIETKWRATYEGWAPPYFPNGG
ncbi:NlpC/P60 family protein [Streptomyces sp. VNUA116]|uniref:NlpC/P60 family protein n=1 Tax=Streptomyces sp. VNUA116 TaxID=3062449 RepID=UPI002676A1E6|nr:NlpC/P60 family protein [Streptomyces sp. VNUA116]WKU42615.1 NlpC/P60 family protein [Streptomyces sp. VNUA116]